MRNLVPYKYRKYLLFSILFFFSYYIKKDAINIFLKYYLFLTFPCSCSLSYFSFVAKPPLICLSALFSSNIILTSCANEGFIFSNLSLTSLCTDVTFRNGIINVIEIGNNSWCATYFV